MNACKSVGADALTWVEYNYLALLFGVWALLTLLVMNWYRKSLVAYYGEGIARANRHLLIVTGVILLYSGSMLTWAVISAMRVVYPIG